AYVTPRIVRKTPPQGGGKIQYILKLAITEEGKALHLQHGFRAETVEVDQLLSSLPALLPHTSQQDYLAEAIVCFRHRAFRAAVVMTWNVAYDHLLTRIEVSDLARFNAQLATMFGGNRRSVR